MTLAGGVTYDPLHYPPLDSGGGWFIHVDVRDGGAGSHIVWWD